MPIQFVSRRHLLAGVGVVITATTLSPNLKAEAASDGFRILRARTGTLRADGQPPIWTYDGALPGPTLRVKRGEELRVRLINGLPEPTSIHWHGVRVPNAMDGVAGLTQAAVAPGASFEYRFRPPDAGTFWYRAHLAAQLDRGLHGALIVEETEPVDVDRDILLVFGMPLGSDGSPPPRFLVNGSVRPDIAVKAAERLRLRMVNATSARGLSLRIAGHLVWLMAIDGQPAEPFLARDGRIGLGPGSRVDLFLDMPRDAGTIVPITSGAQDEDALARLVCESGGDAHVAKRAEPRPLPANPLPTRIDLQNALRAELVLGSVKPLAPAGAPLFTAARGRVVTVTIRNPTGAPQVVHLHGHSFRHLDRLDDGWKPYWLDTLPVGAQVERIAFLADNPGKWLIDCRTLERPDTGLQHWFAVT